MKREVYEKPVVTFVETELFEDVAAECWAKPSLYLLVDPTDECEDWYKEHGGRYYSDANYADLKDFTSTNGGCNKEMKDNVQNYLKEHYGSTTATGTHHYLTDEDITRIMSSGGGNMGTSLRTSEYIQQVRSN